MAIYEIKSRKRFTNNLINRSIFVCVLGVADLLSELRPGKGCPRCLKHWWCNGGGKVHYRCMGVGLTALTPPPPSTKQNKNLETMMMIDIKMPLQNCKSYSCHILAPPPSSKHKIQPMPLAPYQER